MLLDIANPRAIFSLHATLDLFDASSDFMTIPFESGCLTPVQMSICVAEFKMFIKPLRRENSPGIHELTIQSKPCRYV